MTTTSTVAPMHLGSQETNRRQTSLLSSNEIAPRGGEG